MSKNQPNVHVVTDRMMLFKLVKNNFNKMLEMLSMSLLLTAK